MTTKEMIEVLQAYERGERLEVRCAGGNWKDMGTPIFNFDAFDYRVKKKEPREIWVNIYQSRSGEINCAHPTKEKAEKERELSERSRMEHGETVLFREVV